MFYIFKALKAKIKNMPGRIRSLPQCGKRFLPQWCRARPGNLPQRLRPTTPWVSHSLCSTTPHSRQVPARAMKLHRAVIPSLCNTGSPCHRCSGALQKSTWAMYPLLSLVGLEPPEISPTCIPPARLTFHRLTEAYHRQHAEGNIIIELYGLRARERQQ